MVQRTNAEFVIGNVDEYTRYFNYLRFLLDLTAIASIIAIQFKQMLGKELTVSMSLRSGNLISKYFYSTYITHSESDYIKELFGGKDNNILARIMEMDRLKDSAENQQEPNNLPRFGVEIRYEEELAELLEEMDKWAMDIIRLNELSNGRPLTVIMYAIFDKEKLFSALNIDRQIFLNYITEVEVHYNQENPFHNNMHAADVVQSSYVLLKMPPLEGSLSSFEKTALLFAAAVHDVDHPGLTNQYLVNSLSELALLYNDESVLENHHLAMAFMLLRRPGCNMLKSFDHKLYRLFRRMVIDMVLFTDMSKHMILLANFRAMFEDKYLMFFAKVFKLRNSTDRALAMSVVLHLADLSNSAKPFPTYQMWLNRLVEELHRQGDLEREQNLDISPMCDKYDTNIEKSQVAFIDLIVMPLYEVWADFVYPHAQHILTLLRENLNFYKSMIPTSPIPEDKEDELNEEEQETYMNYEVNWLKCEKAGPMYGDMIWPDGESNSDLSSSVEQYSNIFMTESSKQCASTSWSMETVLPIMEHGTTSTEECAAGPSHANESSSGRRSQETKSVRAEKLFATL